MPPLRATVSLSLLVLAVTVAGTAWLSAKTYDWTGPAPLAATGPAPAPAATTPRAARRPKTHAHGQARLAQAPLRPHAPPLLAARARPPARPVRGPIAAPAAASVPPARTPTDGMAELVPLSTPSAPVSYAAMRGHLSGNLVMRIWVDGAGQVADAQVAASSGDPILDAHALASVRRWRFAVPSDKPDGITGELPIRFEETRLAQGP